MTAEVLMATRCTKSLGCGMWGTSMQEMRGACFAGRSPSFLGRERAAVDVGVKAQREEFGFNPKYLETLVWHCYISLQGKLTTHKGKFCGRGWSIQG